MSKYLVEVIRKQEASATVEVNANTSWEAREKALDVVTEQDYSTFNSAYEISGSPVYVRAEGLINQFTPYWNKLDAVFKELGYTLEITDNEDEPAHFSKGLFARENRIIKIEIYLPEKNSGEIKLSPIYPTYDFDHTNDPYGIQLRPEMTANTYKTRITKFVKEFEPAHRDACLTVETLARANQKGKEVADRINRELGIITYSPIFITAHRGNNAIRFSVGNAGGLHDPIKHATLARILQEEGIV